MDDNYLKQELYDLVKGNPGVFDFIQSGSLDGIWYWDLQNPENEWMSPKFWETFGYDPMEKEHLSGEWQNIIFEEDLKVSFTNFEKHCADSNFPYDQVVRYRHKDGSVVWIRCRGMAIRDDNGKAIRMVGAHTDITKLKQAEEEIRTIADEYEKVFNGTQDSMFLVEIVGYKQFRYIRNNLSHQLKTRIGLEQFRNKTPQELLGKELGEIVTDNYQRCVDAGQAIQYEEELILPGGARIWLTTLTPIFKGENNSYIVGSAQDITERKALEIELERSANYDKLTKLPNRRLLFDRLRHMLIENKRDGHQFAVLFIDLDGFKEVNDSYGHEIGDKVLVTVAERLSECVRESDTVARMGGDEFVVTLRNVIRKEDVERVVSKIYSNIKREMYPNQHECRVDSSIGVVMYPKDGEDLRTLLRNADFAMYSVKNNGKSGYRFFS